VRSMVKRIVVTHTINDYNNYKAYIKKISRCCLCVEKKEFFLFWLDYIVLKICKYIKIKWVIITYTSFFTILWPDALIYWRRRNFKKKIHINEYLGDNKKLGFLFGGMFVQTIFCFRGCFVFNFFNFINKTYKINIVDSFGFAKS